MSKTIQLEFPIQSEGTTLKEITIRALKARDLKIMEMSKGGEIAKTIDLIAHIAEIPTSSVEELYATDFLKVSEVVASFLGQK